jgi:hypothetical protein
VRQASYSDINYFLQHLRKIWKTVYFPISFNSDPSFIYYHSLHAAVLLQNLTGSQLIK